LSNKPGEEGETLKFNAGRKIPTRKNPKGTWKTRTRVGVRGAWGGDKKKESPVLNTGAGIYGLPPTAHGSAAVVL